MAKTKQYCTFFLNDFFFGVEVEKVQEVIRFQKMTKTPLAPPYVRGLINLRGQIVTAIDLRRLLDMGEFAEDEKPMNVIIRSKDGAISYQVNEIGDVLEVDDSSFEYPPETLEGVARELIKGACKLEDRLLLVLDADKAVAMVSGGER